MRFPFSLESTEKILLSIIAVFAPISAVINATLALVFADFVTGVMSARKRGDKITSRGFKRTAIKLFMYETALCVSFLAQQYLVGDFLPILKIVSALIGLTELKSVLENLDSISGGSLFKTILNRIDQSQKEIDKTDKKEDNKDTK